MADWISGLRTPPFAGGQSLIGSGTFRLAVVSDYYGLSIPLMHIARNIKEIENIYRMFP